MATAKTPNEPKQPKGNIVRDVELVTMSRIQRLIDKLPTDAAGCA